MSSLFLIPNLLGDTPWQQVLPERVAEVVAPLKNFIVEDVRNARRFLKKIVPGQDIDALVFFELNKHTTERQKAEIMELMVQGEDAGLISEAGCPGVADPGADIVKAAHEKKIRVVPLAGPSSILLALMASGLNGQNFAFTGYLPVKPHERNRRIAELERIAHTHAQTQIFMETPYRNNQLMSDLLKTCQPATLLCVAAGLTSPGEWILTCPVSEWKKQPPDLDRIPVIFILGA